LNDIVLVYLLLAAEMRKIDLNVKTYKGLINLKFNASP